ncbi:unnamed protein product [Mytilus edulis]|uniref:C-type lectin domain-containing protein n=1 Tax=Mytilus edulis TaxID=6550 RepID=A0A8S3VGS6_MYTED|nr:unnamed protein product [Mytilus edulis]
MCAMMCISEAKCCEASYNNATYICRLDTSENCCVTMENFDGWEVIKNEKYEPACTGCISYGASFYKIPDDSKSWHNAKKSCECLGGKLLQAETAEENSFIKNKLSNTAIDGYWLGGYNFYKNGSFEWISNPGQPMTYSDMHSSQPNALITEL